MFSERKREEKKGERMRVREKWENTAVQTHNYMTVSIHFYVPGVDFIKTDFFFSTFYVTFT